MAASPSPGRVGDLPETIPLDTDGEGPAELEPKEIFWRDHQPWLQERGYMLRPRYRPDWKASWIVNKDLPVFRCEDSEVPIGAAVMDATRTSDGEFVMLKRIKRDAHPFEIPIAQFFSNEPWSTHPRNHCVPALEVLDVPDDEKSVVLVMPFLRQYNDPRFETVGEAVEFFRQILLGLQFMHQCHVAHRDCMTLNIMMDPKPTFPEMYHPVAHLYKRNYTPRSPKQYTRTARPTKYYLIDFGISRQYEPNHGPIKERAIVGGDKSLPEFQKSVEPCDPFPTDVYYIGNVIRRDFLGTSHGLEFMVPLVTDMVQDDPTARPTMDQVVERFDGILKCLPWWKLRARLVPQGENPTLGVFRSVKHLFRTVGYIALRRKALPAP